MQLALIPDERAERLAEVDRRLREYLDVYPLPPRFTPVDQLIRSLVGKRTKDPVSLRAFFRLRRRFPDLLHIIDVDVKTLYTEISDVTFADRKAEEIRMAVDSIYGTCGSLNLEFLGSEPLTPALQWLERLRGVGRKVSAATLNFSSLQMRALVIDTHVLRVAKRLNLVGRSAGYRDAFDAIMPLVPPHWTANDLEIHHVLVKRLGQTVCPHGGPFCGHCPLQELCPTAANQWRAHAHPTLRQSW